MRFAIVLLAATSLGGCATTKEWANDLAVDNCRAAKGCYVTEQSAGGPPHAQAIEQVAPPR